MNHADTSTMGVQDVGLVVYVSESHYRFLASESRKLDLTISDIIRRIVENAIRDTKEANRVP